MRQKAGFSLMEILIVLGLFAVLTAVSTQAIFLSIQGTRKSEASVTVRENLDQALAVVERRLRGATDVVCSAAPTDAVTFTDQDGVDSDFSCEVDHLAQATRRLTSSEVGVTACLFVCSPGLVSPETVTVTVTAIDNSVQGIEQSQMTTAKTIVLRNY